MKAPHWVHLTPLPKTQKFQNSQPPLYLTPNKLYLSLYLLFLIYKSISRIYIDPKDFLKLHEIIYQHLVKQQSHVVLTQENNLKIYLSLHLSLYLSLFFFSLSLSLTIPLYTWYCPSLSPQHSSAAKRPHRGYPRGSSEPILKFVRFFAIQCIVDAWNNSNLDWSLVPFEILLLPLLSKIRLLEW